MQWFAHVANVLFLGSYLVRDILWLRLLSILGGLALVPYYLYGEAETLYVPLAWNVVFNTINIVQIVRLLRERRPVRLSAEERRLYELVFASLPQRAFVKLIGLANWRAAEENARLVTSGEVLDELLLIDTGQVTVRIDSTEVATLDEGRFIGEMSFLTGRAPSADVVAAGGTRYVAWPCEALRGFLKLHPEVSAGLKLILGTDLAEKLRAS